MNVRSYAVAVFAVCTLFATTLFAKNPRTLAAEDDIREAVLRFQMTGWAEESDKSVTAAKDETGKAIAKELNFKVFFISINGGDPSDAFMKRFQNFARRVERQSRSEVDKQQRNAVVDKATGEKGIVFRVDKVKWDGANSAEVDGGYFCNGLCASGQTFKVQRKNGIWTVTGSAMHWIS
jgi:hypothetical protein